MGNETIIQECQNEDISIPTTKYDFISIDKIANIQTGTLVGKMRYIFQIDSVVYINFFLKTDICGICKDVSDIQTFQAKSTGRELKKKEVVLVDQSNNSVSYTF